MKTVTRIAPSPTGYLHFGLARTALFNYLYARKNGGEFVVRIEDTDIARNKPEYENDINEQLAWLGLIADRSFRQSEQVERHKQCLKELIENGKAYVSREAAKDDATKTVEVVRLKNPGEKITFTDGIRGDITFDTTELKDFVIARSINEPLFHFAVVVDDHDEGITHVIRGDDHVSNTPRQILILKALGFDIPFYTHLPLILMTDKSKMSKRKHETSVKKFRESGILPQALINYIALLGWTPPSTKEVLSLEEMVGEFDLEHLHKSAAIFDIEKLRWFNRQYLMRMSETEFRDYALPVLRTTLAQRDVGMDEKITDKLLPIIKERTSLAEDIRDAGALGEWDFFFVDPKLDPLKIPQKGTDAGIAKGHLSAIMKVFTENTEDFTDAERIKGMVWDYATEHGRGAVLWPLRYSLTGLERSPDPFVVASIVGRETTIRRIGNALAALDI